MIDLVIQKIVMNVLVNNTSYLSIHVHSKFQPGFFSVSPNQHISEWYSTNRSAT